MRKCKSKMALLLPFAILIVNYASCASHPTSVQHTQPQNSPRAANTGLMPVQSQPLRGKAAGEVLPFKLQGRDLKASVLAHPFPKIWLVFPDSENQNRRSAASPETKATFKVELPVQAKEALLSQWKVVLTSRYYQDVAGLPDAQSVYNHSVAISNATVHAKEELRKVQIDAPDGRRGISFEEADDLVYYINLTSSAVVQQAKEYKTGVEDKRRSAT